MISFVQLKFLTTTLLATGTVSAQELDWRIENFTMVVTIFFIILTVITIIFTLFSFLGVQANREYKKDAKEIEDSKVRVYRIKDEIDEIKSDIVKIHRAFLDATSEKSYVIEDVTNKSQIAYKTIKELLKLSQEAGSESDLEENLEISNFAQMLKELADEAIQDSGFPAIKVAVRSYLSVEPNAHKYRLIYANALYELGEVSLAVTQYLEIPEEASDYKEALLGLKKAYTKLGAVEEIKKIEAKIKLH